MDVEGARMQVDNSEVPDLDGLAETQEAAIAHSPVPQNLHISNTEEADAHLLAILQAGTQASQDDFFPSNSFRGFDSQGDTLPRASDLIDPSETTELRPGNQLQLLQQQQQQQQPQLNGGSRAAQGGPGAAAGVGGPQHKPPYTSAGKPPRPPQQPAGELQRPAQVDFGIDDDLLEDAYNHDSEIQQYHESHMDDDGPGLMDVDDEARPGPAQLAAAAQRAPQPPTAAADTAAAAVAPRRPSGHPSSTAALGNGGLAPQAGIAAAAAVEAQIDALFDDGDADMGAVAEPVEEAPPAAPAPGTKPPRLLACDVEGECMSVTTASGLRVYCAVEEKADDARRLSWQDVLHPQALHQGIARPSTSTRGPQRPRGMKLLSRPISEMMRDAREAQLQAALEESRQALNRSSDPVTPGARGVHSPPGPVRPPSASGAGADEQLWVSKYAPRKFMTLLSDEQTNRQVAKWVKSWDGCVFGKPTLSSPPGGAARQQGAAGGRGPQHTTGPNAAAAAGGRAGGRVGSDDSRPEKKVILLCGPPGLGKTTLAHVVARHCGYHPYEINASDDRTAATLTERVNDAVQMQPVLGERRPNCVIIDEIDGATGGAEGHSAISALMAIINAGAKPEGKSGGKKGRKGRAQALSRPIICIANDLYAPALRPLRDAALVFHFKPPSLEKLVMRLTHICSQENVHADKAALVALAQRCDCDIRTCLNTLQFLAKQHGTGPRAAPSPSPAAAQPRPPPTSTAGAHAMQTPARAPASVSRAPGTAAATELQGLTNPQGHAATTPHAAAPQQHAQHTPAPRRPAAAKISVKQIEQLAIGSKDTSKGMFTVWDAMLHLPRQGGVGGAAATVGSAASWATGRGKALDQLYRLLQDCGEYELIMSGLHTNLLGVRYLDVHLKNTAQMLDALADADRMLSACRRRLDFGLLVYVPSRLLTIHLLAAQPEKPHLQWPKALAECSRKAAANKEMLRTWAGYKVSGRILQASHIHTLALETVPALLRLLSPSLRLLAPHLLNPTEQACMQACTAALVGFGLRYALEEDPKPNSKFTATGQPVRPVPLEPPLDTMHQFSCVRLQRGPQALRPIPLVLRQMLNQQANLEQIRQAQMASPHAMEVDEDPAAAAAALEGTAIAKMMGVTAQPAAKQPLNTVDGNAAARAAKGQPGPSKPAKAPNWLEAARLNAVNKRKAQAASAQQARKRQATGDGAAAGAEDEEQSSPTGSKHQFPVLYRYNEGYTNAVKRPLLIKELL